MHPLDDEQEPWTSIRHSRYPRMRVRARSKLNSTRCAEDVDRDRMRFSQLTESRPPAALQAISPRSESRRSACQGQVPAGIRSIRNPWEREEQVRLMLSIKTSNQVLTLAMAYASDGDTIQSSEPLQQATHGTTIQAVAARQSTRATHTIQKRTRADERVLLTHGTTNGGGATPTALRAGPHVMRAARQAAEELALTQAQRGLASDTARVEFLMALVPKVLALCSKS